MDRPKVLPANLSSRAQRLADDRRGTAAIEFAIVAPVLLLLFIGMIKFGMAMSQYLALSHAASQGAMVLAFSRGNAAPYTRTVNAIVAAAPNLQAASLATTISVGGTACTDDASCRALMAFGVTAQVTTTYPCDLLVMGVDYGTNCSLTGASAQMVQ